VKKLARNLVVCALAIALVPAFAFAYDFGPTVAGYTSESNTAGNPLLGIPAGWFAGLNIPSPGSNGGAGASFWRNDTLWLFAINGDSNGSGEALGANHCYNFRTNTWATLAVDPQPRAWTSACRSGTTIYVVGGLPNGATSWAQMTGTIRSYNITTNTWTTLTAAPTPCGASGMVAYQDSLIYAIGGMGTTGQPITNVQLYNVTAGTWRAATALPIARATGWVAILRDTLYYGSGVGPSTSNFNADVYRGIISPSNKATITWTLTGVTYPVAHHQMDADLFGGPSPIGNQIIIGPGSPAWWGTSTNAYIWNGGTTAFTSIPIPIATSATMVGAGSYVEGIYRKWRFGVASGLVMTAPYHILNTQVYADSVLASGVESPEPVTRQGALSLAVSPNPSRGGASVAFSLPVKGETSLKVYDAQGRLVKTLASGTREAGTYRASLSGLSAGVYFLNLQAGTYKATKSLVVVR
jgi:hypothetical protein